MGQEAIVADYFDTSVEEWSGDAWDGEGWEICTHWTRLQIAVPLIVSLPNECCDPSRNALREYVSSLSKKEKETRQAEFYAWREAWRFLDDFRMWLKEQCKRLDEGTYKQHLEGMSFDMLTRETLDRLGIYVSQDMERRVIVESGKVVSYGLQLRDRRVTMVCKLISESATCVCEIREK